MKNKVLRTLVASMIISTIFAGSVLAAPDADAIKQKKEAAEEEVSSLQEDLTEVLTEIDSLETQLVEKGEEIDQATTDLEEAEALEQEQYEAMKLRIKYLYEEGDYAAVEKMMQSGSISEFLSRAEYISSVHTYDRNQLNEYVSTKETIAELKTTLETEQAELEATQEEFTAQKESLDTMIAEKETEVENLEEEFQAAVQAAEEERKAREEAARQAAAAQQAANSRPANRPSNNGGGSSSGGGSTYYPPATGGGTGDTSTASAIVNAAYSQLGTPYVWGGTRPNVGLDCSGLTQYCHRMAGISIPRTSGPQGAGGVAVSNPQPGDLVCYSGHVGIYIGGGQMIHAPQPGDVVRVQNVYGRPWYRRYW